MAPRLEIRDLARAFGGRRVVDGISLAVEAGQVACLLGPSGCGKSTTLRMIAGVEVPDGGAVLIDGKTVSGPGVHLAPEARGLGMIFQDFALFPHLSVVQNVAFGLTGARADKLRRAEEMLERVSLEGFGARHPHELSGGEQQRVALARALAPRPRVMLMDEPFSGLDNRLRDGIRDATLDLLKSEGAAVVLVTHEPEEAMRMGDLIALMRDGRIVQAGSPRNLWMAPVDRAAAAFFGDVNVIRARAEGALVETAFGRFLVPGMADGAGVEIVIRPQHLKIDFDRNGHGPSPSPREGVAARGIVLRSRLLGRESLVEFRMEADGVVLKASVPGVFLPQPGVAFWLMLRRDRCLVFAA